MVFIFNRSIRTVLVLTLTFVTTIATLHSIALAQNNKTVKTEDTIQTVEQKADQATGEAAIPNSVQQEETGAVMEKDGTEPAPIAKKGALFWDKVLSIIGLQKDKPFKPDQITGAPNGPTQDYVIGPGDQLGISIWHNDTLTKTILVLPNGKIQFPLIEELIATNKTVTQLKKELKEKLIDYIINAELSMEIKQSNNLFVYLIGKINSPDQQILLTNTNVLQALAMTKRLNPFAGKDDIRIFRQEGERTLIYPFRYSLISAGSNLEENIWLKRGDVIVVP